MTDTDLLQTSARRLLLEALGIPDDLSDHPGISPGIDSPGTSPGISPPARCPALWVLPELLSLLEEFRDHPAHELRPMIHRLIVEQNFVDECGDCVFDAQCKTEVAEQVDLILNVLEKVRLQALQLGVWSDAPVTQPWCG